MASTRLLKKDINDVTNELIIECFTYNYIFPEKIQDDLAQIIAETIEMRSDLLTKVNQVKPSKENPAKKQFKKINDDFNEKIENLVERLEKFEKA